MHPDSFGRMWRDRSGTEGVGSSHPREEGRSHSRITQDMGLQYTGTVTQNPNADETSVRDALRRQVEDPGDHDASLIEECLNLTADERLQRLTSWVAFVTSARPIEGLATSGRD